MLSSKDVQSISSLLLSRVQCQNAQEGIAIAQLVERFVQDNQPTPKVDPIPATRVKGKK